MLSRDDLDEFEREIHDLHLYIRCVEGRATAEERATPISPFRQLRRFLKRIDDSRIDDSRAVPSWRYRPC